MSTYDVFKKAMIAVEENNSMNGASWKYWNNGAHILKTYEIKHNISVEKMLNKIILCDNFNDIAYDFLKQLEFKEYGRNFSDNSERFKVWELRR